MMALTEINDMHFGKKKKKKEIIPSIFSDHNSMKLEINNKYTEKHAKTWKLNYMLLNNE